MKNYIYESPSRFSIKQCFSKILFREVEKDNVIANICALCIHKTIKYVIVYHVLF